MRDIAIRRLRAIAIDRGSGIPSRHRLTMLSEISRLGIKIKNPTLLHEASEQLFDEYHQIITSLKTLKGGHVDYVPLFTNFPNKVPDGDRYFAKRVIGYVGHVIGLFDEGTELANGMIIPPWLFELENFGADPITQFQTKSLWKQAQKLGQKKQDDTNFSWLDVEFVFKDELDEHFKRWSQACLTAKSSIKTALHEDLRSVLKTIGCKHIKFTDISIKENRTFVSRILWEQEQYSPIKELISNTTDILRLMAALTDSDISLASNIRFPRLNRQQRKFVMSLIEQCPQRLEDMNRYRGLWLQIGRYLHPGENKKKYPRTAEAFDKLRNSKVRSFDSITEQLLTKDKVTAVIQHLKTRPGVLARRLHEILRRFPDQCPEILDNFAPIAKEMTVKNLFILKAYFASINDSEYRTVINKSGKIKVLVNNSHGALSETILKKIKQTISHAINSILKRNESWDGLTVWVDPALKNYTVPLAQRAASDGVLTIGRGSRIACDFDKVLRLFVYWKERGARTDLDLSVIRFNESFKYLGHVSYTNLKDGDIVHSGDLQSAPFGAAEFIDIKLNKIPKDTRYIASQVYRFFGDSFNELTCHAGWMIRDSVNADYKSFDIKTVQNKFDLHGSGSYCLPLVVDLKTQEIIFTDLFIGNKTYHNNVEGALQDIALVVEQISRFTQTRPTMYSLAMAHAQARSAIPSCSPKADISFGLKNCTYNVFEVEKILSELL